jgi:hypothetical protein
MKIEKTAEIFITIIFLIFFSGMIMLLTEFYNIKKCEKYGVYNKLETKKSMFKICEFNNNGKWENIKNYVQKEELSTVYPQDAVDNLFYTFYTEIVDSR